MDVKRAPVGIKTSRMLLGHTPQSTGQIPGNELQPMPKYTSRKFKFRQPTRIAVIIGGVCVCAIVTAHVLWPSQPIPLPTSLVDQTPFLLYSPVKLPTGYAVDQHKAEYSAGVATYVLQSTADSIVITQQPKPPSFNFTQMTQQGLTAVESFSTGQGSAITGKLATGTLGALATESTLIIVSSPTNLELNTIKQIIRDLRPASSKSQ